MSIIHLLLAYSLGLCFGGLVFIMFPNTMDWVLNNLYGRGDQFLNYISGKKKKEAFVSDSKDGPTYGITSWDEIRSPKGKD